MGAAARRSIGAWPKRSPSARCCATGTPVRFTGQDSRRGTFNQRHAVLFDAEDRRGVRAAWSTCSHEQGAIRDRTTRRSRRPRRSGSSTASAATGRRRWCCWEAQFGDFAQRRAGHHRPVRERRRGQVGPALRARDPACRTVTRDRDRSTRAPGSSASCSWPPRTTCRSASRRPRRSTSTCCGARRCGAGASRWWS